MPNEWDDDFKAIGTVGQTNVAATAGVRPQDAVDALKHAPGVGVPPVMAMGDPKPVVDMAASQKQRAILNTSPSVASWAATGPVKVAATKDDFSSLAAIGQKIVSWNNELSKSINEFGSQKIEPTGLVKNLTDPIAATFHNLPRDAPRLGEDLSTAFSPAGYPRSFSDRWEALKHVGTTLGEVANLFPGIAAFSSGANALVIQPGASIFDKLPAPYDPKTNYQTRISKAEQHKQNLDLVGSSLFGLSPGAAGRGVIDFGNVTPQVPRIAGPVEPIIDAEFHPVPGSNPALSATFKDVAKADAEQVSKLQETVASSATHERSPELMEEYLNEHTSAGETTVSVPPQAIAKLWDEGHEVFPEHGDAVASGLATGSDVQMSLGSYVTATAGQPFAEELNKDVKLREGGVSVTEADALPKPVEPFEESILPQVMYHGTNKAFTEFELDAPRNYDGGQGADVTDTGWFGKGIYFTPSGKVAGNAYATHEGGNVIPAYLNLKNPLRIDLPEHDSGFNTMERTVNALTGQFTQSPREQTRLVKEAGHDGVLIYRAGKLEEAVAFDPEQVKSALSGHGFGKPSLSPEVEAEVKASTEQEMFEDIGLTVSKAIKRTLDEMGLARVIQEPKALGISAKQFEGYSARLEEWERETHDRMANKLLKQLKKERTPDWKAALALHKKEALASFEKLPHVQAYQLLQEEGYKLNRAKVNMNYPELATRLPPKMLSNTGIDPDAAAELAGFETGGELVSAMSELHNAITASGAKGLKAYIKLRADVYATEQARILTGFDMSPEALYQEVLDSIDSPKLESLLVDQLKEAAEAGGLPFDKAGLEALTKDAFNQLTVKDALKTKNFAEGMRRQGNKAEEGLLGEKAPEAFAAKQKQFIQFRMLKHSLELAKDFRKTDRKFTRWAKQPSNKNIDQEYMNYVHAELISMGYNVKRNPEELLDQIGGVPLTEFVQGKEAQGKVIFFENFPRGSLQGMKVSEYESARNTLSSLIHNGRVEAGIVIHGRRVAMTELFDRIKANAEALGNKLNPEKLQARNIAQNVLSSANAYMIKGEQLLDEMDRNDPQGPLNQAVVYPLQAAKGVENDMFASATKALKEFGKTQPKEWLGTMKVKLNVPELKWTNPVTGLQENVLTTRGNLVKLMLNLGNAGNLSKLLEGYGWEYGDVMAAVHQHATKADWDFVQQMWDRHEELWPEVKRVYRNLAGVAPKRVEASAVQTPFGVYRGGYFPIKYDHLRSPEVKTMSSDSVWGDEYSPGLPANSYTKGRTAYVAPLDLTFEGLNKSLGQVIHDLAFREAIGQAVRVLRSTNVKDAIQYNFGPSYAAQLQPWLEYAAREKVFSDRAAGYLENFFAGARSNITFVGLAYRRTSAIIHATVASSDSLAEVGAKDFSKAAMDIIQSPGQFKYWMDFISTNSPEIRHRMLNMDQNIREAVIRLTEKQGFLEESQKFGYHMLAFSDALSAAPTWLAAYRQEIGNGYSPAEAFEIADKRVRQAHGASHPVDVAAVQRGGSGFWSELGKSSFGLFLSFMNHSYNRLWAIGRKYSSGFDQAKAGDYAGATRDWSKASAMSLGYVVIPAILVTLEKTWFKTGNPIPKHFIDWVDGVAHTTFGGAPGVGTLIEHVENKEGESPLERALTTSIATVKNAAGALERLTGHNGKVSKRWLQQGTETAGYWTGKIAGASAKDAQYLWDVSTGAERPPKDLNDLLHVLATGGRAKK